MTEWKRERFGHYTRREGKVDAIVRMEGEIWRNMVYYDGHLVDCGEWDSRGVAFRNAVRAMKNAVRIRAPLQEADLVEKRADEDEDMEDMGG